MMTGVSAKIKDKRIDRHLKKMGFNLSECEIYYSPITGFLWYLLILIAFTFPIFFLVIKIILGYPYHILTYFTFQYLTLAYLNNSYVITNKEFIVINPNFPFKRIKIFELEKIEKVVIDSSKYSFLTWIFFILHSNYVEIQVNNKKQKFYSIYLEVDFYDENITEKNLDDFNKSLNQRDISTEFNL